MLICKIHTHFTQEGWKGVKWDSGVDSIAYLSLIRVPQLPETSAKIMRSQPDCWAGCSVPIVLDEKANIITIRQTPNTGKEEFVSRICHCRILEPGYFGLSRICWWIPESMHACEMLDVFGQRFEVSLGKFTYWQNPCGLGKARVGTLTYVPHQKMIG